MSYDHERRFNWNLEPDLDPAWVLLDNDAGSRPRDVPVHIFGIGHFRRMQIGVRVHDRETAEQVLRDPDSFVKMPKELSGRVMTESYAYMGKIVRAPNPYT